MNWIKKRKLKKLLGEKEKAKLHKPSHYFKKVLSSLFMFRVVRFFRNQVHKLNTSSFGTVFVVFCIFLFCTLVFLEKMRIPHYMVPPDVNSVYVELSGKYATLAFISIWNFVFFMCNCIWANRRPRKPQIYPEGEG